jgi:hypothetical protein
VSEVEVGMREYVDQDTGEVLTVIQDGWFVDESGLPIFSASSIDAIESEISDLRSMEGEYRLKMAAVLAEASEKRFYGESTLERVCRENQINYSTGQSMVAGYRRLASLTILERSSIVSAIRSGELYWSKVEIAAPVKDDQAYTTLMNQSANGSLSAAKLRKRVSEENKVEGKNGEEDSKDDYAIERIVRVGAMEYIVEFANGSRHTTTRAALLGDGWSKCSHCSGHGITKE